jgi:hypothetical protein
VSEQFGPPCETWGHLGLGCGVVGPVQVDRPDKPFGQNGRIHLIGSGVIIFHVLHGLLGIHYC